MDSKKEGALLFRESQRFNAWWMSLPLAFVVLLITVVEVWQGTRLMPLVFSVAVSLIVPTIIMLVLRSFRLETIIDETGVSYQFSPIFRKPMKTPWSELTGVSIREYKPLREYGGWGMRSSRKNGYAFTMGGKQGLQLIYKNGKRTLIGTGKAAEINNLLVQMAAAGIVNKDILAGENKKQEQASSKDD